MLHRLYIDEVGNGDLKGSATDNNERYLSLTGVITRQDLHASRFQKDMDQLKADLLICLGTPQIIQLFFIDEKLCGKKGHLPNFATQ